MFLKTNQQRIYTFYDASVYDVTTTETSVPPVVEDGEIVTNYQYLFLRDTDKLFCDES